MTVGVLFPTAVLLGGLAFFEPCTVAVHALFMERGNRAGPAAGRRAVGSVWLVRILFVSLPLVLAVELLPPFSWPPLWSGVGLAAMAGLYLFTRQHYLPVPHLELYRLLPGGAWLPRSVQLGLTLPACTLPLYLVLLALVTEVHDAAVAVMAGALFGTFFSLPMLLVTLRGLRGNGGRLLGRVTKAAPYLTALLLFGAGVALSWPSIESATALFGEGLRNTGWTALALGFAAGLLFSFNPVSFAAIPVVLAYVTRATERERAFRLGLAFVAGLLATHLLLGVASALGGDWVQRLLGRYWGAVLGPVLIFLGLLWAGIIRPRLPWFAMRGRPVEGAGGAFLLAVPFSVAVCPFCAPALLVALTASAAIGSPLWGGALLLAFAAGRGVPILLGAWSLGWLESVGGLARHHRVFEVLGRVVLVLTGLYLLNSYFLWVNLGAIT